MRPSRASKTKALHSLARIAADEEEHEADEDEDSDSDNQSSDWKAETEPEGVRQIRGHLVLSWQRIGPLPKYAIHEAYYKPGCNNIAIPEKREVQAVISWINAWHGCRGLGRAPDQMYAPIDLVCTPAQPKRQGLCTGHSCTGQSSLGGDPGRVWI